MPEGSRLLFGIALTEVRPEKIQSTLFGQFSAGLIKMGWPVGIETVACIVDIDRNLRVVIPDFLDAIKRDTAVVFAKMKDRRAFGLFFVELRNQTAVIPGDSA